MANYPKVLESLIAKLMRLPGIGRRSAERIAFQILNSSHQEAKELADSILRIKHNLGLCKICNNLSEKDTCDICQDPRRHKDTICVVEEPKDVLAVEKTANFNGVYHVLMGSIAPLEGRGPDDLKIKELLSRLKNGAIKEVIIATDSDTEGETTALYLTKLIKPLPLGMKISRIGVGIPVGSNLEYIDSSTLSKALESRREV